MKRVESGHVSIQVHAPVLLDLQCAQELQLNDAASGFSGTVLRRFIFGESLPF